jgi:UPF0755 protein
MMAVFRLAMMVISLLYITTSCDSIGLYFDGGKTTKNDYDIDLFVPTGTDLEALADLLIANQIIDDSDAFLNVGKYKDLSQNRIAAGYYVITPNTDFKTLLNGFTKNSLGNGNAEREVNVVFNNCRDIYQLAGKVAKHIEADSASIASYILSDSILKRYGFTYEKMPALFLPNTYRMYWDTDEVMFLNRMAEEFKKFWTEERKGRLAAVGLKSQSDAVTLASIIYKEQDKHAQEWPIIARLYLNRIKAGWPLQSDPTFRFCWGDKLDGVKRLSFEHRDIDCPYNTYKVSGLPPGPICIPPAGVIDAVLYPADNNYMFMCAKPGGDGLHNFAKSYDEHLKNSAAFNKWMDSQGIRIGR